jgi:hypothetical protein
MAAHKQLRSAIAAPFALIAALGCGAEAGMDNSQLATPAGTGITAATSTEGNAPSLVVPMSMVIPKKMPMVPAMTAPPIQQPAQGFPSAGGSVPGAGVPGASAPGGAPTVPAGAGAAGAAAPPATPTQPAAAGAPAAAAPGSGMAKGFEIAGVPEAELSMLRDTCVAEINMYRASLTDRMLKPITRANPDQEECSEKGAKMDGDSMSAHGAARAGVCRSVGLSSENTCPGWPVGGGGQWGGGNATIADALKGCLKAMWDEGEPPMGRDACIQDTAGCFQAHGHYLNMSDPNIGSVACSFYKMMDGRSYWMNQDFTSTFTWGGRM